MNITIIEYLVISIFCFTLSTFLFTKAAGTLNLGKINMVSYLYYLFMLQTFAGTVLVVLGFNKHYTIQSLINHNSTIKVTFIYVMLSSILIPLFIIFFEKVFKIKAVVNYDIYLKQKVEIGKRSEFCIIFCASAIVTIFAICFFVKIGYIPLIKLFTAPSNFNFVLERGRLANMVLVNQYATNILLGAFVPMIAYLSFAFTLINKEKKWAVLTLLMFILSILIKTDKFEKSPLVFHFFTYLLIYIYIKGGIRRSIMYVFVALAALIIIMSYFFTGFHGTIFDIYNGPMGRTLFTQVGTLMFVFDLIPRYLPFLGGRSLAPTILRIIGKDPTLHLRSGKLIMAYYGSEGVYSGGAGVMNTFFIGEAFANYGWRGVAFSLIWVSFFTVIVFFAVLHLKKTPWTVVFFAMMTSKIGNISQGGFFDFIYSFDFILTAVVLLGGYWIFNKKGKIQTIINETIEGIVDKCLKKSK